MPGVGELEAAAAELNAQQAVGAVANALEKLVARNDLVAAATMAEEGGGKGRGVAAFRGLRRPAISIEKYMERIHSYALCSPACFVVAFVYVDRAVHRRPDLLVGSLNVHRLMLTSVMVASKFFDVMAQSNAFYAKVGGVSNAELNNLEIELLCLLDFKVNVSSHEFESYLSHLEKEMLASRTHPNFANHSGFGGQQSYV
ncbi:cyclin-U1-1 [Dendrobium catenatum]|uniref:Cyclin n=1 Tax=Dendrobium catenatum TaxID=906689 RepID=A0A2I0WMN1_9ASPA|nr:cyclin-U1-1 [Dendrobium catenatum]PKU76920.1 Cyclin-U1-1 [Dendrobium catenatum]